MFGGAGGRPCLALRKRSYARTYCSLPRGVAQGGDGQYRVWNVSQDNLPPTAGPTGCSCLVWPATSSGPTPLATYPWPLGGELAAMGLRVCRRSFQLCARPGGSSPLNVGAATTTPRSPPCSRYPRELVPPIPATKVTSPMSSVVVPFVLGAALRLVPMCQEWLQR